MYSFEYGSRYVRACWDVLRSIFRVRSCDRRHHTNLSGTGLTDEFAPNIVSFTVAKKEPLLLVERSRECFFLNYLRPPVNSGIDLLLIKPIDKEGIRAVNIVR